MDKVDFGFENIFGLKGGGKLIWYIFFYVENMDFEFGDVFDGLYGGELNIDCFLVKVFW